MNRRAWFGLRPNRPAVCCGRSANVSVDLRHQPFPLFFRERLQTFILYEPLTISFGVRNILIKIGAAPVFYSCDYRSCPCRAERSLYTEHSEKNAAAGRGGRQAAAHCRRNMRRTTSGRAAGQAYFIPHSRTGEVGVRCCASYR